MNLDIIRLAGLGRCLDGSFGDHPAKLQPANRNLIIVHPEMRYFLRARRQLMEIQSLAKNLGLDLEDFNEIFEIYAETTSSDLEELKQALRYGDAQRAHEKAHSIKGASGNLGLDEVYELAKEIDDRARANSLDGLGDAVHELREKHENLVEDFKKGGLMVT